MRPVKIAVVGAGWRADFYIRLALMMPEKFDLVGWVIRNANFESSHPVPRFQSISDLLAKESPDFVVSSVSWDSNPLVVKELVAAGIPVLSETPPAKDEATLNRLWEEVGKTNLVQVAEQYTRLPMHAARLQVARSGEIGQITSVQVCSTHGYHAVAIMREFLGAAFAPATVRASFFSAPLVDPLQRGGWTKDPNPKPARTVLATIDFGDDKSGLYDFTDNQWHNQLRHRRLVVRGSKGEISDLDCIRLVGPESITTSTFHRYQLGHDLNLDGHDTEHISFDGKVVYKNPFVGLRLMDEEIAIATLLQDMASWVKDQGPAPYPLAEACQDLLISLAIDQAVETGDSITTGPKSW